MIEIINLSKKFNDRVAVQPLNLKIEKGEIFGLLGPNGAGKTTTIRMLTMLLEPSGGDIIYDGINIRDDEMAIKSLLGIVPQHINLDRDLTVWQNMELHGRLHHISRAERQSRITELLNYVDLQERRDELVQNLSGGMKRRLLIARALIHRPKILFLDEPTVALDPQVRRKLWDLIRQMKQDDITVVLTTHYIEEAENLCQRVAVLEKGALIALDTPDNLKKRVGQYVVEWEEAAKRQYRFFGSREQAAGFAGSLEEDSVVRRSNLEDVFVEITGRKVNSR